VAAVITHATPNCQTHAVVPRIGSKTCLAPQSMLKAVDMVGFSPLYGGVSAFRVSE
jgi:hypothetical protein